ncbi:MAG: AraC family transcriptional regulator [Myxococcaceae bacterium]|nr:AraC family transcriptional regulator [Myxococcaceae bacterium]
MVEAADEFSGSISARMLLRAVELCRRRGHDVSSLAQAAGIDPKLLADPEARIPYALGADLSERVLALTADENFGLHLAQDVEDSANFDAGVLLLMASASVRAALERMVLVQRYWGDGPRLTFQVHDGGATLCYLLPGARGAYARHADECMMAELVLGIRKLTGKPLSPTWVRFRHRAPRNLGEHEALFHCELGFAAAHTEVAFDDAVLDTPMHDANAAFCAIFEQQVQRALARLPETCSASADVRSAVHAALASGQCTLAGTASRLGVSTRTLQRRLQHEGTSFAGLIDALRRELASAYLARGLPIAEVASLLGYADGTAFHHAFRRWNGVSPAHSPRGEEAGVRPAQRARLRRPAS